MTLDQKPETDRKESGSADTSSDRETGGRYVAIETTPYMPPDMTKKGRSEHGRRLANKGLFVMAISGVIWLLIGSIPFWLFGRDPDVIFLLSINFVRQLSVIGAFGGLVTVVIGYAQLVLSKQLVLEQHLIAQLKDATGGRPEASPNENAATDVSGDEGESSDT
jgi:hypothetical protein